MTRPLSSTYNRELFFSLVPRGVTLNRVESTLRGAAHLPKESWSIRALYPLSDKVDEAAAELGGELHMIRLQQHYEPIGWQLIKTGKLLVAAQDITYTAMPHGGLYIYFTLGEIP